MKASVRCYAMSGTGIAYGTVLRYDVQYWHSLQCFIATQSPVRAKRMLLRFYAMSGTGILLREVRSKPSVCRWWYPATRRFCTDLAYGAMRSAASGPITGTSWSTLSYRTRYPVPTSYATYLLCNLPPMQPMCLPMSKAPVDLRMPIWAFEWGMLGLKIVLDSVPPSCHPPTSLLAPSYLFPTSLLPPSYLFPTSFLLPTSCFLPPTSYLLPTSFLPPLTSFLSPSYLLPGYLLPTSFLPPSYLLPTSFELPS
eukprot:5457-Rhodomonas_salina.4